jgi:ABC-type multidrug transport system fused ATPase/permease subunit
MNMQKSIVAWDRIVEIINMNSDSEKKKEKKHVKLEGNIKFENANLSYGNQEILSNINLNIRKRKTVALVGESGGGKSSLISLLTGINKCTSGNLYIDGININEIYNYNNNISLVEQEPVLFSGSILENITMGNRHISFDEVVNAAQIANIHEYILSLPQKYNTQIDERGKNMSIGQKQRLAITRSIVKNPIIFIMDEPTANLDLKTEKNIFESISSYLKTRTSIIASHRLPSITFVDEILVIENGNLIEQGTHEVLLNKKGYYYNLWNKQQIYLV